MYLYFRTYLNFYFIFLQLSFLELKIKTFSSFFKKKINIFLFLPFIHPPLFHTLVSFTGRLQKRLPLFATPAPSWRWLPFVSSMNAPETHENLRALWSK